MKHRMIVLGLAAGLMAALSVGTDVAYGAANKGTKPTATTSKPTAKASAQLRKDWKLGDLKLTREAVEDATYPQDIRKSAIDAIDSYLSQQEKLLDKADTQNDNGAAAKKSRSSLETEFQQKMKAIYGNAEYKAELEKRIKALKSEMDDLAAGANKMFADLDAAGVTAQQKAKIKTKVDKAAAEAKEAKNKGESDDVVADKLKTARTAIKGELTEDQKAKLKKNQLNK